MFKLVAAIKTKWQRVTSHVAINPMMYPPDESGELMRRTLAQKSWFDWIAAAWCDQPFWIKSLIVFSVVGLSLGLGFGVGYPILVLVATAFILLASHLLLVAHESQRRHTATLMAQETIALNQDLKAVKELLKHTVHDTVPHLESHAARISEQATELDVCTVAIKNQCAVIEQHTQQIETCAAQLHTSSHATHEQETQLQTCLEHLIDKTLRVTATMTRIDTKVSNVKLSNSLSDPLFAIVPNTSNRYALFTETSSKRPSLIPSIQTLHDELLETDHLIESLGGYTAQAVN